MGKIFYFDYCAILIMIAMLCALIYRRLVYGKKNITFLLLIGGMLLTTIFDMGMEHLCASVQLSKARIIWAYIFTYGYFLLRNASNLIYIFFILVTVKPTLKLQTYSRSFIIYLPYVALIVVIFSNFFTGQVFSVSSGTGYNRGPMMKAIYVLSISYTLVGIYYLIKSIKYIDRDKWIVLLLQYPMAFFAVALQFFFPQFLIEMFSMSISVILVMLLVLKPEETIAPKIGIFTIREFFSEMRKYQYTKTPVSMIIIRLTNSHQVRAFLGEEKFTKYIAQIAKQLNHKLETYHQKRNIYFDQSGCFFVTLESDSFDMEHLVPKEMDTFQREMKDLNSYGLRFDYKICTLRFPKDVDNIESISHLAAIFPELMEQSLSYISAAELVNKKDFKIRNDMNSILDSAIKNQTLEMYYQPIYSVKEQAFVSAEALIRLKDPVFGFVPPSLFIPAAEQSQFIQKIGDYIIQDTFRFISKNNFSDLGLKYIEINLSVSQCIQRNLSDKILLMANTFGIDPSQVNFEITESAYNNSKSVMDSNINTLANAGFSISLDDYGTGYSNMQRIINIPLSIIKIDKSLIDTMETEKGLPIVKNTISMMHDINMHIVAEGVETKQTLDKLKELGADYIQGYYFSRPLPEQDFIAFLKSHNKISPK